MNWKHKDLLDIESLSDHEIRHIFSTSSRFIEINSRSIKKVPILKGKSVVLFFAEPSTRTKTSFDMAAKRLSADSFSLATSGSSLKKGESLKDTVLTLEAMKPDAIVIRHSLSGSAAFVAEHLQCSVINAGDGWHAHPTQALLDGFTLNRIWEDFSGKTILILGDIAHSRVARSDIKLFSRLGCTVRICAPRTLLPARAETWPVKVFNDLNQACREVDAIISLRLQLERQKAGLLPDIREYAARFCLSRRHVELAAPGVKIMHPGPMNRGIEIASDLADSRDSLILDQVESGVAVRMALLYLYLAGSKTEQELPEG
ncbi:aspartate carbamoyltransferase catalytic subunit [Desulfonatronovibrio hydrogenovorans]|uniref:aspartate carbamoyltransferase catalytic subunit n=1 Tax=Desulfonatronovibrio hydrogenovorans TaxID=53245 RepID=UPI0004901190|nr:aspartate carbamoyltransferase catalytic subunit [Desulfonatronovibrio hydrogenovorans]